MKPCDESCPKCGGTQIHRVFFGRNVTQESKTYNKAPFPRWTGVNSYTWWPTRDFIAHRCTTCQYQWQGSVLPKPKKESSAPSEPVA
jgi:hypothetical protein